MPRNRLRLLLAELMVRVFVVAICAIGAAVGIFLGILVTGYILMLFDEGPPWDAEWHLFVLMLGAIAGAIAFVDVFWRRFVGPFLEGMNRRPNE